MERMACMVLSIRVSRSQPSMAAPFSMTGREQPAAKLTVLNFLRMDLTSRSDTLLEGRIRAVAQMSPVSSSTA